MEHNKAEYEYYTAKIKQLKKNLGVKPNMPPKEQFELYSRLVVQNKDIVIFVESAVSAIFEFISGIEKARAEAMTEFLKHVMESVEESMSESDHKCKKH